MKYFGVIFAVSLLVLMLVCLELGRRYALTKSEPENEAVVAGKRIIEGAFFGLLSLLIAFSFSGAVSRFDSRRVLIVQEANDIGTAYLRIDLLAPEPQTRMRDLFRTYLDARLSAYRALPDLGAAQRELARATDVQNQIWPLAVASTRDTNSHPDSGKLLLPSLNSMFDTSNSRTWAAFSHPPMIIYAMLFLIALICAFIAGGSLAAARRKIWAHRFGFVLLTCVSIFVVLEIEFPRMGFIDIESYDQALVDVRNSMTTGH
jgi:hypothetical protein